MGKRPHSLLKYQTQAARPNYCSNDVLCAAAGASQSSISSVHRETNPRRPRTGATAAGAAPDGHRDNRWSAASSSRIVTAKPSGCCAAWLVPSVHAVSVGRAPRRSGAEPCRHRVRRLWRQHRLWQQHRLWRQSRRSLAAGWRLMLSCCGQLGPAERLMAGGGNWNDPICPVSHVLPFTPIFAQILASLWCRLLHWLLRLGLAH